MDSTSGYKVLKFFFVESVYQNWHDRYPFFFENVPEVQNGFVQPPDEAGLDLKFKPDLFKREDIIVETIPEA